MSAAAAVQGFSPNVAVQADPDLVLRLAEREKYQKMWTHEAYRQVAPGEGVANVFLTQARPVPGSEVIDFGAGTGRGALMLALMGGCKVHMLDFAENCLDPEVRQALETQPQALSFTTHDLNKPAPISAQYGYCTDVLEHIPPQNVDRVLTNILRAAQHVFFQISCVDDVCGALIGEPLHLSVHDYAWWLKKLQSLDCIVHWSQNGGEYCMFYVTAWQGGAEFVKHGVLNVSEDITLEQVKQNIAGPWATVAPHAVNDAEVLILGGGPSLAAHLDEIRALRANGAKLVTLNGAYNWALQNDLEPSATVVVDAREFNARFTHPVVDRCKYLISSQVHPAVLEGLPVDRTLLWHTGAESIRSALDERYETWWAIPGGSTVMLRAIPLLRLLGFTKFRLYGFDSCFLDEEGHAYAQPENDKDIRIAVTCRGRVFDCAPWHVSQAQEFMDLIKYLGNEIELEVAGDGLIAWILQQGAHAADLDPDTSDRPLDLS
jgi:hypothetical protein